METHRGVREAVAVGGDYSTLAACEKLTAIRHPGTAGHLWAERYRRSESWRRPADLAGFTHVYLVKL